MKEALIAIIEQLKDLPQDQQVRVLRSAAEYYNIGEDLKD